LQSLFKDATNIESASEIYVEHNRCSSCNQTSDFLCDKSLFKEEHLREWLINKKLFTVSLENNISTIKGINELYQKYTLKLLRQGYWWTFTFADTRCQACIECNMEHHRTVGFKKVQNRRIIRCIDYFNLHPKISGSNIAYVLV